MDLGSHSRLLLFCWLLGHSASDPISLDDDCAADSQCSLAALQKVASRKRARGFKVVGAGLPKTGTSSLKVALDRLGYRTVHGEFLELNREESFWETWLRGDDAQPALKAMLGMGYDAAVDRPWCWAYAELLRGYPEMKVILTEYPHGGSEGWANAFEQWTEDIRTIPFSHLYLQLNATPGIRLSTELLGRHLDCHPGYADFEGGGDGRMAPGIRERCRRGYEAWYEEVRETVPKEQLLVYSVKQGWEPLCRFLEVSDCPKEDFPHTDVGGMVVREALKQLVKPPPDGEPPYLPLLPKDYNESRSRASLG